MSHHVVRHDLVASAVALTSRAGRWQSYPREEAASHFDAIRANVGPNLSARGDADGNGHANLEKWLSEASSVACSLSRSAAQHGRLGPGEVLGEIAFFTRKATVRAREASVCFVIRDADRTRFAFKHH